MVCNHQNINITFFEFIYMLDRHNIKKLVSGNLKLLVGSILWSTFIASGLSMGTPTVVVPQLRAQANSTEAVSSEMASWLASILGYSGTISVPIVVSIGHFLGRKLTLNILSVIIFISSTIIFFSKTAVHIFISQFITGFTIAAQTSILLLIFSEYTSPKYRGLFLTLKSATFFWGIWIANTIGIFTHYKYIGLLGMLLSLFSFIVSLIMPESPYWLAFKGKYSECAIAHRWLKGVDENTEKELDVLIKSQKEAANEEYTNTSIKKYCKTYVTAFKQPDIYKPTLISCLVFSIYHFSGKLVCAVYAIEMMKKVFANQSMVYSGVLILDGFTVLGMYIGCGLAKNLKRRTLLLSTSITGTVFLFVMSFYLYMIKISVLPDNAYVIISMLIGYSLAICCGPLILATSISAELLPIKLRSTCVIIYSMWSTSLVGTVVKLSPYVFNTVGFHGAFLGFGISSSIVIILLYKFLPETKDKTLYEIAAIFKKKEPHESTQTKLIKSTENY